MLADFVQLLERFGIPERDLSPRDRRQLHSIGMKPHLIDGGKGARRLLQNLAIRQLPADQLEPGVAPAGAAADGRLSVGTDIDALHGQPMAAKRQSLISRSRIPQLYG